jgi:phosphopantetheinyl transferase (holo-ACP synthase)
VVRDASGKPALALRGIAGETAKRLGVKNISMTITHTAKEALAQVIFEN